MNKFSFKVLGRDRRSRARAGEVTTAHGKILTPAFVPVATQASVKALSPQDLIMLGIQVIFVNAYHLHLRPGEKTVAKLGGLHQFTGWSGPIMTDSGGFQVFSLGRKDRGGEAWQSGRLTKLNLQGVEFSDSLDGCRHRLTPKISIQIQKKLGADIIMAFDDCPPYPVEKKKAEESLFRTHEWAKQSLEVHQKSPQNQALYGIIQGSVYQDLRLASTRFISSLPFDGLAIGGVAVGESKQQMRNICRWVSSCLPEEKPRHLLGVGEVDDLFDLVEEGIDTFDSVIPTRLGRMGWIMTSGKDDKYDITKKSLADDSRPPDLTCRCWVCQNFSRSYLNHLFRAKELLAYRLATYHNLSFYRLLMVMIRQAILENRLAAFRKEFLK